MILQQWIERISMESFQLKFKHAATFNNRLRSCGGRYLPRTGKIEISWKHWESFGEQEVEAIIKHELCHYHLHQQRRGYRHRDPEFKALLAKVGGARYCSTLPVGQEGREGGTGLRKVEPYRYQVRCNGCARTHQRKRIFRVERYRCAFCRSTLSLEALVSDASKVKPATKRSRL